MIYLKAIFALFCFILSPVYAARANNDPFIVVAPPGVGASLLTEALERLTDKECLEINSDNVLPGHDWVQALSDAKKERGFIQISAHPSPHQIKKLKKLGVKVLFLIRDPRDQAVALLFTLEEEKDLFFGPLNVETEPYSNLSFDEKLHEIITGDRTGFSAMKEMFEKYLPWINQDKHFVLTVRFEDLAGKGIGGTQTRQKKTVKQIAHFLRLNLPDEEIRRRLKGFDEDLSLDPIGFWRSYFKIIHFHSLRKLHGSTIKKLGYTTHNASKKAQEHAREQKRMKKQKKREREVVVSNAK